MAGFGLQLIEQVCFKKVVNILRECKVKKSIYFSIELGNIGRITKSMSRGEDDVFFWQKTNNLDTLQMWRSYNIVINLIFPGLDSKSKPIKIVNYKVHI